MIDQGSKFGSYEWAWAVFSDDRKHRRNLGRRLGPETEPRLLIVGLNPSTAGSEEDDPTIRREVAFARALGFSVLEKCNLFEVIATDPRALSTSSQVFAETQEDADTAIDRQAQLATMVVAAWGALNNRPAFVRSRGDRVLALLRRHHPVHCFRRTKSGYPEHPLYLPSNLKPVEFASRLTGVG